ncbi:MAG: hypothetical protein N4A45_01755 [Flavobacteriales bacterium]|jgi:hypothetical protein|nr:hypothetical protein [Flavobacteriales bacterium]
MKKLILLSLINVIFFSSCSDSKTSKAEQIKTETKKETTLLNMEEMPTEQTKSYDFTLVPSKMDQAFVKKWKELLKKNDFKAKIFRYERDNNLSFYNCVNNSMIYLHGEDHIEFSAAKEKGIVDGAPRYTFLSYHQIDFKNKADAAKFIRLYKELNTPKNKECFINQKHRILQEEGKVSIFYTMHKEAEQLVYASADLLKEQNKGAQLIE